MFDKYGEFGSAEELNMAAEGFAGEGDIEAIFSLAEENGIDKEDAQDYIDGMKGDLATEYEAAIGRLKVQAKEAPPILLDIAAELCDGDHDFCRAVMAKGMRVNLAFRALWEAAQKEARKRHPRGNVRVSACETDRDKERLLKGYFLKPAEEFERVVREMVEGGVYESF